MPRSSPSTTTAQWRGRPSGSRMTPWSRRRARSSSRSMGPASPRGARARVAGSRSDLPPCGCWVDSATAFRPRRQTLSTSLRSWRTGCCRCEQRDRWRLAVATSVPAPRLPRCPLRRRSWIVCPCTGCAPRTSRECRWPSECSPPRSPPTTAVASSVATTCVRYGPRRPRPRPSSLSDPSRRSSSSPTTCGHFRRTSSCHVGRSSSARGR